jgi:D-arabinose 1-dehydrogenase-like Zn-dependent alcohol dehydrogenase
MRSVQVSKPKGPLEIVEKDIPEPGNRQVRIKVQACGICHSDSFTKEGLFPGIQYPRVPGHEIAGLIDKIGADVTQWESGQRVAVGWMAALYWTIRTSLRRELISRQKTSVLHDGPLHVLHTYSKPVCRAFLG